MKEDATFRNDYVAVWLARVVDVLSCIATSAAIDGPFSVDVTNRLFTKCLPSPLSFNQANSLAHVFRKPLIPPERNLGKTSCPVDRRFSDVQAKRNSFSHDEK
jgi:hypothetical protein